MDSHLMLTQPTLNSFQINVTMFNPPSFRRAWRGVCSPCCRAAAGRRRTSSSWIASCRRTAARESSNRRSCCGRSGPTTICGGPPDGEDGDGRGRRRDQGHGPPSEVAGVGRRDTSPDPRPTTRLLRRGGRVHSTLTENEDPFLTGTVSHLVKIHNTVDHTAPLSSRICVGVMNMTNCRM